MYQIAAITPGDLARIKIRNQDKIIELTGSKLEPSLAYEIIKKSSKGFTEMNSMVKEADALFAELLKTNGITLQSSNGETKIRLKEQERARAIKLLALELELVA
jgi:hypothetical protein